MKPSKNKLKCIVSTCSTTAGCGIPLFRFPTDIWRRSEWTKALNLSLYGMNSQCYVCVLHFLPNQLIKSGNQIALKTDAVPSVEAYWKRNLPDEPSTSKNQSPIRRSIDSQSGSNSINGEIHIKEEEPDDSPSSSGIDFQSSSSQSGIAVIQNEIKEEPDESSPRKIGRNNVNGAIRIRTAAKRKADQTADISNRPDVNGFGMQLRRKSNLHSATATVTTGKPLIFLPNGTKTSELSTTTSGEIESQQPTTSRDQSAKKRIIVNPAIRVTPRQSGIPAGIGIRTVVRPIQCIVKASGGITTVTKQPATSTPRIMNNANLRISRGFVQRPSSLKPVTSVSTILSAAMLRPLRLSSSRINSKIQPSSRDSDKKGTSDVGFTLEHPSRPKSAQRRISTKPMFGSRNAANKTTVNAIESDRDQIDTAGTSDDDSSFANSNSFASLCGRCEVITASRMKFEPAKVFVLYTGIGYDVFEIFSKEFKNSWPSLKAVTKDEEGPSSSKHQNVRRQSLQTCEDELLMVLIKMKTNFSAPIVAYLFDQETDTVVDVLQCWIPFLANWLAPFITWPSNKTDFGINDAFKNDRVPGSSAVLDVMEITGHTTREKISVKFVVVYTWDGAITYRSRLFDGKKQTDRNVILACGDELGFTNNAGSNFPDRYVIGRKSCVIKDHCALLDKAADTYRSITSKLRQFGILSDGVFPNALIPCLDDIVTICCALMNLQSRLRTGL